METQNPFHPYILLMIARTVRRSKLKLQTHRRSLSSWFLGAGLQTPVYPSIRV